MYAQSHAVHWTQEYDQEELRPIGLHEGYNFGYNYNALVHAYVGPTCLTLRNNSNTN